MSNGLVQDFVVGTKTGSCSECAFIGFFCPDNKLMSISFFIGLSIDDGNENEGGGGGGSEGGDEGSDEDEDDALLSKSILSMKSNCVFCSLRLLQLSECDFE